jgi:hypothetical protein
MDVLQEVRDISKKSFISHVFSTTEEGKAEILNVVQYATLGIIPIVLLNKAIQRFIPEADSENTTLELLVEIFLQIIVMFCGVVIIHRLITYFPTYSGFKYENLTLTNVILAFLIIVLSIQTKLGIKVNILTDRVMELWNGPTESAPVKKRGSMHTNSQSDYFNNTGEGPGFPPAPVVTTMASAPPVQNTPKQDEMFDMGGPQAANGVLGGSFGSFF